MIKFFQPEDFKLTASVNKVQYVAEWAKEAADTANAKLEKEGRVVYFQQPESFVYENLWLYKERGSITSHKALLINIEPIETCTHPKEKIKYELLTEKDGRINGSVFQCECGAKVKPSAFEEEK